MKLYTGDNVVGNLLNIAVSWVFNIEPPRVRSFPNIDHVLCSTYPLGLSQTQDMKTSSLLAGSSFIKKNLENNLHSPSSGEELPPHSGSRNIIR